jgi:hypothetical protein
MNITAAAGEFQNTSKPRLAVSVSVGLTGTCHKTHTYLSLDLSAKIPKPDSFLVYQV